ncbi:ABC transporter ATP-binding protein [Homoserinimonas sp. OAct 916]|uniref:ABC transporter ATP-binding protein n=1 Tax=Homoserinimonas sp. OAct 916 TaxID=2211450 RepID=UPI001E56C3A1|nr:ABC transporter ATP-binding protein [Homoserinimonas sp. OAct 916]
MTKEAILDLQGLSKSYDDSIAVDNIDLSILPGEFLTFLGPSGSGKTTTLNLIAGFVEPTAGSMLLNGAPLEKMPAHERNLGVVFQHYALFPHMTVTDNVAYPLKQRKFTAAKRAEAVRDVLKMVRLEKYASRYPAQLSGGQQQRVALARAIVYRPPILLMDEPLGALDKKLREWLQMELRRIHRELGSTFIYVTHDQEEALTLSDRIAVFNEGRIEQIGTGKELYDEPNTLFVGKFIGESSVFEGSMTDGRFHAGGKEYWGSGTVRDGPAALLVRPEKLSISDEAGSTLPEDLTNWVIGEIEDIVFVGSGMKYTVNTAIGGAVAHVPAERAVDTHIGDHVRVAWHPQDAKLLPA